MANNLISNIGKEMLSFQADLADKYKYKPIPPLIGAEYRQKYLDTLPEEFIVDGDEDVIICSLEGTPIAKGYTRVVIGDYGAFVEILKENIIRSNIKTKEGQEYRYKDEKYSSRVKYLWLTARDTSDCKIYYQKKTVSYADYKPDYFYISPFEVVLKKVNDE